MARSRSVRGLVPAGLLLLIGCASNVTIPRAELSAGEFIEVTCSVPCEGATAEAAVWADQAIRIASDWLDVPPTRVGRLHLARDEAEYARIEGAITRGRFRSNLAFSNSSRRLSVVAIQPPAPDSGLARAGLPMQTLRLAAHEASHLTSYSVMTTRRRIPGWIEEGLATLVEAETRRVLGALPEALGEDPLLSTYYVKVRRARDEQRLPDLEDVVQDLRGGLSGGEEYAMRAVLFRSLRSADSAAFRAGLVAVRAAHGEGQPRQGVTAAFVDAYGGLSRMESALDAHLDFARPRWEELTRSLDTSGEVWTQWPFEDGAQAVRTESSGSDWSLSLGVRLRGEDPLAAITLRDGQGVWGFVRISRSTIEVVYEESRAVLHSIPLSAQRADSTIPLRITVSGSALTVTHGTDTPSPLDLETTLSGPWGLLAGDGGWVEWSAVDFSSGDG